MALLVATVSATAGLTAILPPEPAVASVRAALTLDAVTEKFLAPVTAIPFGISAVASRSSTDSAKAAPTPADLDLLLSPRPVAEDVAVVVVSDFSAAATVTLPPPCLGRRR